MGVAKIAARFARRLLICPTSSQILQPPMDDLVNGARGTVVEFVRNGDVIVKILVLFDNPNVG